jgi:2-keto-4-pentenoate hydratase/2-oxohepta-3-ene-1,7-dioic acid hydratase in catechol pathway
MKIALIDDYRPAVVDRDQVIDASAAAGDLMNLPPLQRMPAIIEAFDELRPAFEQLDSSKGLPLSRVTLRAPVPRPSKILCAAANFREGVDAPLRPLRMFLKSPQTICDPNGTVRLPQTDADVFHHEAELAAVIGKPGYRIAQDDAMEHVFGYCCFIDVSARGDDRGIGYTGKSYDTFGPLGPWIVTRDEIQEVARLRVRLWADGVLRQDYGMDDIAHPIPEIISYCSEVNTLLPGDLLACGTNHQQLGPMQDGESFCIEIDGIGRMEVSVEDPLERAWPKGIDEEMAQRLRAMRGATVSSA